MGGLTNDKKGTAEDRLALLWRRVKEHRIAQWTVGYVAVAYGVQHGVTLTADAYDWPHSITRVSITLLALGVPVAMTLAWYHGERVSRRISGGEMAIVSVLLVLTSLVFYAVLRPAPEEIAARTPVAQEATVTAARAAAATPKGAISVAVLPFLNLSSDKEQEFFSDGMTEEITAALAKVPDLRVVARTSAFEFKGKSIEIEKIGQQLHATHLIEGSVRKAGNRLRITVQLIKAGDGTHIWAEDYDRDLTDVFSVQEDIARAITASLHMTLGLKPGEQLVNARTVDPASHEAYLKAKSLVRLRNVESVGQAIQILEDVVARDPDYAPAWGLLGTAHHFALVNHAAVVRAAVEEARPIVQEHLAKGLAAAQRAITLDPKNADGFLALAYIRFDAGKRLASMDLRDRKSVV
jgi:TolB-like protein